MNVYKRIDINSHGLNKILNSEEVKFIIVHHTGGNWRRVKSIFETPKEFGYLSAHFVIDIDGSIDEVIDTLKGTTFVGAHAGISYYISNGQLLSGFNMFSIGIELVNPNGNLLPFSDTQYTSIIELIKKLQTLYPHLSSPNSILGHNQISNFRGKVDPGILFDWSRIFGACYGGHSADRFQANIPTLLLDFFEKQLELQPPEDDELAFSKYWHDINSLMEKSVALLHNGLSLETILSCLNKEIN